MIVNLWLALRDDSQALIKTRLTWDEKTQGEYTGPVTDRQFKLFSLMQDRANRQRLFRIDRVASRDWIWWSLDFDFPKNVLQKIKAEIDDLIANFPNHVKIIGAWHWDDGRQVKQGGTPVYPVHARILELMPDVVTFDEFGNETSRTRPTVPSDINLGLGQTPRQF